jgi:hypothetical protein
MSEEPFAISKISPAPAAERDYESICAALMDTERGRWFLQEYAKRNRSADTKVLLVAIERIEAVVCAERNRQLQHGLRSNLLEMAEAITRTRAEVAEIRADAGHPASAGPDGEASPAPPQSGDVFAAAERIRDVTWAMRGHGFDPSTCDQLEELAGAILSASSLRDPTDHRASKLSEVLQYLEHRIDTLLESDPDGDAPPSEPEHDAFEPIPTEEARPGNGFADTFVIAEYELYAAESQPVVEASADDAAARPPSDPAGNEPATSTRSREAGAQAAAKTGPSVLGSVDGAEAAPTLAADPLPTQAGDMVGIAAPAPLAKPPKPFGQTVQVAFLPTVELPQSYRLMLKSPTAQAAATVLRAAAARTFLPEIEMGADGRDIGAAPARGAPWTTTTRPAIGLAHEADPAEPGELTPATAQPADWDVPATEVDWTAPQPAEPLVAPLLAAAVPAQQSHGDPLAAVKAMSDDELIALFS